MKLTLNDILVKRDEALADVRKSGKRIKTLTGNLFEPPKATGRFGGLINNFDRVVAVYDGVMLGMKINLCADDAASVSVLAVAASHVIFVSSVFV